MSLLSETSQRYPFAEIRRRHSQNARYVMTSTRAGSSRSPWLLRWQYRPEHRTGQASWGPLPWITQRHLLKPHSVVHCGTRNVQVAVHHGRGVELTVPVCGELGPAPLGELRISQYPSGLADQWPVVDQHQWHIRVARGQPSLGLGDPRPAPCLPARIRIWVQQVLINADDPGLMRIGQRLFLGVRAIDPEGVVIEQK